MKAAALLRPSAFAFCAVLFAVPASAQLFTYTFDDVTTSSGRTSAGGTSSHLVFSSFTATSTLSPNSNTGGVFAFGSWVSGGATDGSDSFTGDLDTSEYFEFSITPDNGFSYALSGITFSAGRTTTGPRQFVVRSDADNYATNLTAGAASPLSIVAPNVFQLTDNSSTNLVAGQSITLSSGSFTNLTTSRTFRIFAYNAEGSGQFRIDNVAITGTVSAVPEPATAAALGGAAALLAAVLVRRRKKSSALRAEDAMNRMGTRINPSA